MAGIRHIEFWVARMASVAGFYAPIFGTLGWERVTDNAFALDGTKIYFREKPEVAPGGVNVGPRHICFQAASKEIVDQIAGLPEVKDKILHGPGILHPDLGGSYMLVFRDPDGYILEVAATI